MSDWKWFQDLKDKWATEDLAREADQSLSRDPGRWSWGKSVEQVVADEPTITRHSGGGDERRHRGGNAGQKERGGWSDREWETARQDYQRQNATYLRQQERQQREDRQSLREQAAARREAAREVRERVREANEAVRRGDPPPGWRR